METVLIQPTEETEMGASSQVVVLVSEKEARKALRLAWESHPLVGIERSSFALLQGSGKEQRS